MTFILLIQAIILGIVEGLTEFLPISSTGHLILVGDALQFTGEMANVFEVVIQLGAILAICWEYRVKLFGTVRDFHQSTKARQLFYNLILGFLPAAMLGFFFIHHIKAYLFTPFSVACALIVGGLIILWIEKIPRRIRVNSVDELSAKDALKIGLAQCLALIPGTSRSGSTIMGAMLFGIERKAATEFSFFLAIPVMFAATFYDLYKSWAILSVADLPVFAVGFIAAFLSALLAVKALLRFITTHTFIPFAWYRIILGGLILGFLYY